MIFVVWKSCEYTNRFAREMNKEIGISARCGWQHCVECYHCTAARSHIDDQRCHKIECFDIWKRAEHVRSINIGMFTICSCR